MNFDTKNAALVKNHGKFRRNNRTNSQKMKVDYRKQIACQSAFVTQNILGRWGPALPWHGGVTGP